MFCLDYRSHRNIVHDLTKAIFERWCVIRDSLVFDYGNHATVGYNYFCNSASIDVQVRSRKGQTYFCCPVLYCVCFFSYIGGNKELIAEFIDRLILLDLRIIGLAIMGVTLLLNAISFALSAAIYAQKEF